MFCQGQLNEQHRHETDFLMATTTEATVQDRPRIWQVCSTDSKTAISTEPLSQVYQGRSKIFGNGRCISGLDQGVLFPVIFLILLIPGLFYGYRYGLGITFLLLLS